MTVHRVPSTAGDAARPGAAGTARPGTAPGDSDGDGDGVAALWEELRREGSRSARDRLAQRYYPLVHHVARKVAASLSNQAELDDLEGYGAEGLIDAIDRFDPARGVQFPTFAAHRIRGAIYDGIRNTDWVPRSVRRKAREIQDAQADLCATYGRQPTEEEVARALDLEVRVLRSSKAQVATAYVSSLEGHAAHAEDGQRDGRSTELHDPAVEPLAVYLSREAAHTVRAAMGRLTERERTVAALSFGEGMTLAEIGRTLGVTESRACQIRSSALSRLRVYMRSQGMGPDRDDDEQQAGMSRAG